MVLSDVDIKRYIAQGKITITPELPPDQFGSYSVDFRLGNEFNVFEHSRHPYIDLRENKGIEGIMHSVIAPASESFSGNKYAGHSHPMASRLAGEFKG